MYTFRTKIDSIYITFEATVKTYRKQQQPKNKKKQKTNAHIYNIGLIHVRSNPRDKINVWGETISVVHSMLFHRKNCTPCEIRYTRNNDAFIAVYERAKKSTKKSGKKLGWSYIGVARLSDQTYACVRSTHRGHSCKTIRFSLESFSYFPFSRRRYWSVVVEFSDANLWPKKNSISWNRSRVLRGRWAERKLIRRMVV